MKKYGIIIFLTASVLMTQAALSQGRMTREEYILKYKNLAIEDMQIYGIPASITLAQGIFESESGNSRLAREANNHFGIKCKSNWTGDTIDHDDDSKGECFRKYTTVEESYRDHSEFLDKTPRYQPLFELDPKDYRGWANGLRSAGYATNPQYADKLIKLIEDYQLYRLDEEKPLTRDMIAGIEIKENKEQPLYEEGAGEKIDIDNYVVSSQSTHGYPLYFNNGSQFVLAKEGETYETLGRLFGTTSKRLRTFNDAPEGSQPETGEIVYIKAKANRAANGKLIHVAKEGETLRSISQAYGIKLKKLANINRRSASSPVREGQQIRLM